MTINLLLPEYAWTKRITLQQNRARAGMICCARSFMLMLSIITFTFKFWHIVSVISEYITCYEMHHTCTYTSIHTRMHNLCYHLLSRRTECMNTLIPFALFGEQHIYAEDRAIKVPATPEITFALLRLLACCVPDESLFTQPAPTDAPPPTDGHLLCFLAFPVTRRVIHTSFHIFARGPQGWTPGMGSLSQRGSRSQCFSSCLILRYRDCMNFYSCDVRIPHSFAK